VKFFTYRLQALKAKSSTGNNFYCNPKWEQLKDYTAEEKLAAWTRCNALVPELSNDSYQTCTADQSCEYNHLGSGDKMNWNHGLNSAVQYFGAPAGTTELTKALFAKLYEHHFRYPMDKLEQWWAIIKKDDTPLRYDEFEVLAKYMSRTGMTGCSIPFELYISKETDRQAQFNDAQLCKAIKSKDTCIGDCEWKADLYCHEHQDQNTCLSFSDKCKWEESYNKCIDIPKDELEFRKILEELGVAGTTQIPLASFQDRMNYESYGFDHSVADSNGDGSIDLNEYTDFKRYSHHAREWGCIVRYDVFKSTTEDES